MFIWPYRDNVVTFGHCLYHSIVRLSIRGRILRRAASTSSQVIHFAFMSCEMAWKAASFITATTYAPV